MMDLLGWNDFLARRFRRAVLVGATGLTLLVSSGNVAQPAWPTFPFGKKSTDETIQPSNSGQAGVIRKLMGEAKDEEERGNLDRAIVLAEKAKRLSETSSTSAKLAPDVSPAATSRYANDLQSKKTEQSIRFLRGASSQSHSATSDSSSTSSERTAKSSETPQRPKRVAANRPSTSASDAQISAVTASPPPVAASSIKPAVQIAAASSSRDDFASNSDSDRTTAPAKKKSVTRKPLPVATETRPKTARPLDSDVTVAKQESNASAAIQDWSLSDDDQTPVSNSMPPSPTVTHAQKSVATAETKRIKLRPLHATEMSKEFRPSDSEMESLANNAIEGRPTITPMANATPRRNASFDLEQVPLVDVEDDPTTVAASAEPDGDEQPQEQNDRTEIAFNDSADDDFPADKVLELRRRLDSAISLEPGAIVPSLTSPFSDEYSKTERAEEAIPTPREASLRKDRKVNDSVETPHAVSEITDNARQPVVGRSSMIKWRSMKEEPAVSQSNDLAASRPAQVAQDIRQSIRQTTAPSSESVSKKSQPVPSLFSLPSVEFGRQAAGEIRTPNERLAKSASRESSSVKPQLQGSPWDHADVPAINGFSEPAGGEAGERDSAVNHLAVAPLAPPPPPGVSVEQISFDTPAELFSRRQRTSEYEAAIPSGTGEAISGSPPKMNASLSLNSPNKTSLDDQTSATQAILANGPIERLALMLGVPNSTAASMLAVAGLAMFIAGLWTVRAVVRAKDS